MKSKILIAALTFMGLSLAPAAAQTMQPAQRVMELTLEQALEIALSENPTIKVADMEIERQDYVRRETIGNHLPQLSATGNYTRGIVKQEMSKGLSFGADNTITATASLNVPLFAPAIYATLKLNRDQMESAVEAARSSRITMANEVKKAYYGILLAEQSLAVLHESEKTMQEVVDNTRNMYENDLSSEYDLLTAEVQLSNLKPTIIETENGLSISRMMFRMLLGLPQDQEFRVVGSLDSYYSALTASGETLSTDISNNTELRNLDIQASMLENQVKIINASRMPTIAAFGSATYTGNDMGTLNLAGGEGVVLDPMNYPTLLPIMEDLGKFMGDMFGGAQDPSASKWWWQNPVSAGVQINIPIFAGNTNVNKVRQTRNSIRQLQLQRDYLEESVKLQAQSSINTIFAAREKMYANEKTVQQAKKAYDIAEVRYNNSVGTILELNSAQLSLTQAQLNYSQAIYDYLSAQADHEKTIGRDY